LELILSLSCLTKIISSKTELISLLLELIFGSIISSILVRSLLLELEKSSYSEKIGLTSLPWELIFGSIFELISSYLTKIISSKTELISLLLELFISSIFSSILVGSLLLELDFFGWSVP